MDLPSLHKALVTAFSSSKSKPEEVRSLLTKLKIALTEHNLLVPSPATAAASSSSSSDLVVAREVLEIGAFYSVRIGDIPAFDRYSSLLTPFYDSSLPTSKNYEPLLGLKLLRLLSSNQISAFHTLIETLPTTLVNGSKFVQHPVSLERWLMEGSYSKVWRLSRETPPQDEYRFFVDLLMDMIRNEIASCEEKAYDSLALHDAATLLFFENLDQVLGFAQSRGWQVNPTTQVVSFTSTNPNSTNSATVIPKKTTIATNLVFAKELESIV
ncbi:probable 26S proteasome non-atpase regulatory subunit 8 [Ustilago trichophora]|uniref:Probable 26S proteasome non-atpase regulatory subunit 8 n=1 Tax=Ustilago trichophora TaxID=86804 RepID=A0A5C3DV92_9BASI|nr:probable 26S proteasome non-atpase regulatory subunit 8 [Ustilago trichophora]